MVFALVARVDEAILTLVVQFHQHTHRAPFGSSQRAELQVLVPSQRQKSIATIHQVTRHQGVQIYYGRQRVDGGAGNEANDEKDLRTPKQSKLASVV